jgi:hypothetical protein
LISRIPQRRLHGHQGFEEGLKHGGGDNAETRRMTGKSRVPVGGNSVSNAFSGLLVSAFRKQSGLEIQAARKTLTNVPDK